MTSAIICGDYIQSSIQRSTYRTSSAADRRIAAGRLRVISPASFGANCRSVIVIRFCDEVRWPKYHSVAGIFSSDMVLQSVRWYSARALSYWDIEEIMQERGFDGGHSTIHRWVIHYSPKLVEMFRSRKRIPSGRWRLDETYIKVKGKWKYYYRAVNRHGETIDFLLTAKRDTKAALRNFRKAIGSNGKPSLIYIDQSGANNAAVKQ